VKKPAGAVSLFGGVDLLGGRTKSTEVGGGAKKEAPPTSRKPRGSSGLFGDVEEGEEDIFAFTGKKRQGSTSKSEEKSKSTLSHSLFASASHDDTGDLFSPKDEKPSALGVTPKTPTKKGSEVNDLFDEGAGEKGEDLFSTGAPTKPPTKMDKPGKGSDAVVTKATPPVTEKPRSDSLFGSPSPPRDEGLLFGAPPTKPAPATAPSNHVTGSLGEDTKDKRTRTTMSAKVKSAPAKPKEKLGGLFDDDESEDDLFAPSSATPTTTPSSGKAKKKPQVDELFTSAPAITTKPSSSKPAKPAVKQVKPEPSDLFGSPPTSDPLGGDLFTTTPARTAKTEVSLPVPNEAAPGQGDDLFAAPLGTKPSVSLPKKPKKPQAPPTKPPDSDLFASSDSTHKGDPLSSLPSTKTKAQSPPPEDRLPGTMAAVPAKKKPAGAVSLFGGVDLLGDRGLDSSGLFGRSVKEEDTLTSASEPKKALPEVARKPKKSSDSSEVASPLSPAPAAAKLKMGLNIDPSALLPGATHPSMAQEEKAVSFDQPVTTKTLFNPTKTRSRGAARRPPSRRALRASGSGSDSTPSDNLTSPLGRPSKEGPPPALKKKLVAATIPVATPADPFADLVSGPESIPRLRGNAGEEDYGIFSSSKTKATVSLGSSLGGDSLFSSSAAGRDRADTDDLFSTPPLPSHTTHTPITTHTQVTKKPTVSVFDAPPEDIFASHKSQDKDDIFGSSVKQQLKKPEKSLDELLAVNGTEEAVGGGGKTPPAISSTPSSSSQPVAAEATPASSTSTVKKKTKAKVVKKKVVNKGPTDEQLFGNTDDIFGDVPEGTQKSPKVKKKKKKKTEAVSVGADGAVDTATGDTGEKKKMKKKVKRTEPKDLSMFDADAPNIFDDPLSALGTS
jgi:hypothetical protein